jgi:hypothetical protein
VDECGSDIQAQGDLVKMDTRIKYQADWVGANAAMRLLNQDAPSADAAIDDTLCRTGCLRVPSIWLLFKNDSQGSNSFVQSIGLQRADSPASSTVTVSRAGIGQAPSPRTELTHQPKPRPVLLGGALRWLSAAP